MQLPFCWGLARQPASASPLWQGFDPRLLRILAGAGKALHELIDKLVSFPGEGVSPTFPLVRLAGAGLCLQQVAARPKHRTHLNAFRCWRSISTGWPGATSRHEGVCHARPSTVCTVQSERALLV
jgi:hypothetical protein